MRTESKNIKSLDFRQPHLKNVFIEVQKRLASEYGRVITADAVNKAYRRGEAVIFELVKEEVGKCVNKYEQEQASRKDTLKRKEEFERKVSSRFKMAEV